MPTRIVWPMLIGFGPGMARRPSAPTMRPPTTMEMIANSTSVVCPHHVDRGAGRDHGQRVAGADGGRSVGRRGRRADDPRVHEDGDPGHRAVCGHRGRAARRPRGRGAGGRRGRGARLTVHIDRRGDVALLTIDRPERRNAVDHATLDALRAGISDADATGARASGLTGAGGHFCAGADLHGLEDAGFASVLRGLLDLLRSVSVATIAAVDGAALGAGTQLASFCDLRVATERAVFGIPAAKLGLMVDALTVERVVALAGAGPAREMLLAASTIDGRRAFELGMVQRIGDLDAALAWAAEIAQLAPLTIAGHKLALNRLEPAVGSDPDVQEAHRRAWNSADVAEGMAAFRERRPPAFTGR